MNRTMKKWRAGKKHIEEWPAHDHKRTHTRETLSTHTHTCTGADTRAYRSPEHTYIRSLIVSDFIFLPLFVHVKQNKNVYDRQIGVGGYETETE